MTPLTFLNAGTTKTGEMECVRGRSHPAVALDSEVLFAAVACGGSAVASDVWIFTELPHPAGGEADYRQYHQVVPAGSTGYAF